MSPEPQSPGIPRTLQQLPDGYADALAPAARLAALGQLTAGAVHAVNNSVFAMLAHLELLLADLPAEDSTGERLRTIQETGLELRETLRRLGALARGAEQPGPALLDDAAREAVALLRKTRAGELDVHLPDDELPVAGTPAEVAQAVVHVLVHAAAVSGRGALDVRVTTAGGSGELRVTFAPADGDPGAASDGGLGLLVAQAIAHRLGGSLDADGPACLRLALPALGPVR